MLGPKCLDISKALLFLNLPSNLSIPEIHSLRSNPQAEKQTLIHSLRTHQINTLTELRRVEKQFAYLDDGDVTEPMTTAWTHYVTSNNLLSELRGLTRNYPFSSECLDDAKWQVAADPSSVRSWNYCWLVLAKVHDEYVYLFLLISVSFPLSAFDWIMS